MNKIEPVTLAGRLELNVECSVERADSANYALGRFPNGNVEKQELGLLIYGNPTLDDGSFIVVTKVPPPSSIRHIRGRKK